MPTVRLAPWQAATVYNPFDHFAMYGGVASGKSFTGSHFAINMITHNPDLTGFIGANTYDQLSQATLREFFYWLDIYGLEYVIDCRPPQEWGEQKRRLKSYKNTVHVMNPVTGRVTMVFTRVLGDGNPLRGIEFSWYWLDETRDTPEDTHDVILSRMRESDIAKGIITTTTNGEDWSYKRFVVGDQKKRRSNPRMYGSLHIETIESVKLGIITQKYFDTMAKSYSPMMALQELEAKHVNVLGGRAYYAAGERNRRRVAPWGDGIPSRERPIIVGCDFNFAPAPLVWMIGQVGPPIHGANGQYFGDCIHWFRELSDRECSTAMMTQTLLGQFPGYFYQIFGDTSGGVGTTSNAGVTDYDQMGIVLADAGALYTIDHHQADEEESRANPRVRTRVENMNARFCNGLGEVTMTYDPMGCPYFDGDVKMVGWKPTTSAGRGKLDDGGDRDRTHATDGAGYAVMKLFPPGRRLTIGQSVASTLRQEHGLMVDR